MIRSAEIKNFRCFRSVKLEDLKTINVVLGSNASGKTALLESLFLTLGPSPELALRYRAWRGAPAAHPVTDAAADRLLWSDLFRDFDVDRPVSIKLQGDSGHTRTLQISYDSAGGFQPVRAAPDQPPLIASPLTFEYKKPGKKSWSVRPAPFADRYHWIGAELMPTEAIFFPGVGGVGMLEAAERWTKLSITRQTEVIVDEINQHFPFIKNIEVGSRGNVPNIYLDVDELKEKIPIGLVSGGVSKLFFILVAIAFSQDGIILIDEIENGIYYERYETMWKSIHKFCEFYNVQVFTSTHSDECIKALSIASKKFRRDISFIRASKQKDAIQVEQTDADTMFEAQKLGEIR